jgi:hypothetical protein
MNSSYYVLLRLLYGRGWVAYCSFRRVNWNAHYQDNMKSLRSSSDRFTADEKRKISHHLAYSTRTKTAHSHHERMPPRNPRSLALLLVTVG